MFKVLLRWSAQLCAEAGRKILARLRGDPRLVEAVQELAAVQEALEAKLASFLQAVEVLRLAMGVRDEALRRMAEGIRSLGMAILALNGNRHDSDQYRQFYPLGFGFATRGRAEDVRNEADVVIRKVEKATEPWILAFLDRLVALRDALTFAIDDANAKRKVKQEAFQLLQTEKRHWTAGLGGSRLKAQRTHLDNKIYLRWLYEAVRARKAAATASEDPGSENGDAATGGAPTGSVPAGGAQIGGAQTDSTPASPPGGSEIATAAASTSA